MKPPFIAAVVRQLTPRRHRQTTGEAFRFAQDDEGGGYVPSGGEKKAGLTPSYLFTLRGLSPTTLR